MYKINDFVKYQGNLDVFSNNFAKIIGFENFNDIEMVHLLSMHNNQKFWSDYNEIKYILLEEKYLINLGFKKYETQENLSKFTLNTICSPILNMNSLQSGNLKELGTT